jgi:hypothetical protein
MASHEYEDMNELMMAAFALLEKIDTITTQEFARGAERNERERLRHILTQLGFYEKRTV